MRPTPPPLLDATDLDAESYDERRVARILLVLVTAIALVGILLDASG